MNGINDSISQRREKGRKTPGNCKLIKTSTKHSLPLSQARTSGYFGNMDGVVHEQKHNIKKPVPTCLPTCDL